LNYIDFKLSYNI